MDDIQHTIAELLEVPMEDWPEWLEKHQVPASIVDEITWQLCGIEAAA